MQVILEMTGITENQEVVHEIVTDIEEVDLRIVMTGLKNPPENLHTAHLHVDHHPIKRLMIHVKVLKVVRKMEKLKLSLRNGVKITVRHPKKSQKS